MGNWSRHCCTISLRITSTTSSNIIVNAKLINCTELSKLRRFILAHASCQAPIRPVPSTLPSAIKPKVAASNSPTKMRPETNRIKLILRFCEYTHMSSNIAPPAVRYCPPRALNDEGISRRKTRKGGIEKSPNNGYKQNNNAHTLPVKIAINSGRQYHTCKETSTVSANALTTSCCNTNPTMAPITIPNKAIKTI